MPKDDVHVKLALHFIDTIHYLLKESRYADWAAVVVFYASLHIIDAMLFYDPKNNGPKHGGTHQLRKTLLTSHNRYTTIYKHYSIIGRAAHIARYLECRDTGSTTLFELYMSYDDVVDKLIKHHFWQLIKSAIKFLKPNGAQALKRRFNDYFAKP